METLRVKSTDEPSQGPFVVINATDFDPDVHELIDEPRASNDQAATDETPTARRRGRPPKERM